MRILIINPNSSKEMTAAIEKTAKDYANNEFEVVCKAITGAPEFIGKYEDHVKIGAEMLNTVRGNENDFDAFIIACHGDPNIDAVKEITHKPVVGIGEASMKLASMLGHNFSVITPEEKIIPSKYALIRKYNLEDVVASVRAPKIKAGECSQEERLLEAANIAIKEDLAEVIVLGCAGYSGLDKQIQKEVGIPVLDGVVCALIIATGLVKYGVSISKIRRYRSVY